MAKSKVHPTERFLRALYGPNPPGGYIELREIANSKDSGKFPKRLATQEFAMVNRAVDGHSADDKTGLYFGVVKRSNPVTGKKLDCLDATTLWADIDCTNIGMNEEEAIKSIYALPGCLQPSALVRSGGGLHAYWFLDMPCPDQGRVEDYNAGFADLVSGDGIGNIDRIMRLPGSVNSKRGKATACHVVWCWHWHRHSMDQYRDALNSYPYVLGLDGKFDDPERVHSASKSTQLTAVEDLYAQTIRDRRMKANAPGLTAFDRCRPGGGIGYLGREQAMQAYVCARFATQIGSRKELPGNEWEGIIEDTINRVAEVTKKYGGDYAPREWEAMARDRLNRFARDYPGLKADDLKREREERARKKQEETTSG